MELQIIITILTVAAIGIAGGIMLAMAFEVDSRNRQRRARHKRIIARMKARKNV